MVKNPFLSGVFIYKCATRFFILGLIIVLINCNGTARQESTQNKSLSKTPTAKPTTTIQSPSGWQYSQPNQATTEILVKFQPQTDPDIIARIQEELQLKTVQILSSQNVHIMQYVGKSSIEKIILKLQENENVIHAEPNYQRRTN